MGNARRFSLKDEGFSLIEIMVSLGVIGIVLVSMSAAVTQIGSIKNRMDVYSAAIDIHRRAYFVQENIEEWLVRVVDPKNGQFYTPSLKNCLVGSATPAGQSVCPQPAPGSLLSTIQDGDLSIYANLNKTISSIALKDMEGRPLTGTMGNPLFYDKDGRPLGPNDKDRRYLSAMGFMVRDNISGDPGKILFLVRTKTIEKPNKPQTKPTWTRIVIGKKWKNLVGTPTGDPIHGSCNQGEYVSGVQPDGEIICQPIQSSCDPKTQFAYGVDPQGHILCQDLPPGTKPSTPPPPNRFNCDSWDHSTAHCTIPTGKTLANVTVAKRHSRAPCRKGDTFTFSGTTITVTNGCRATFNVFYK